MEANFTLSFRDDPSKDNFADLYNNPWLNWSMLALYVLGLVSCAGLAMVSWFERSGQAGPFRTLANQLVSFNVEQIIVLYVVGFGTNNLRLITGPLPWFVCAFSNVIRVWIPMSGCVTLLCITMIRFVFIYIYKSIPVMDDKLLFTIITRCLCLNVTLATVVKFSLEERPMIYERQCTGLWSFNELDFSPMPLATYVMAISSGINIGFTIAIWFKKITFVQAFNHHNLTNFGSVLPSWILFSTSLNTMAFFVLIQRMDIDELNSDWGRFATMMAQAIGPFISVTALFLYFFITKEHFRHAFINEIRQLF